jgi:hypothetical protein
MYVGTGRFERPAAGPQASALVKLSYVPVSTPERNRTSNFRIRSAALCPLS